MPRAPWRWLLPAIVLLSCVGVWLGHTLEYVRVWGWSGLQQELTGSVHLYMLPVGLGLVGSVALAAMGLARLHRLLARRAERATRLLDGIWRAAESAPRSVALGSPPSPLALVAVLGAVLAVLQVCLYVIQENVERVLGGRIAPGLSVVTGTHWAAPLIHTGVAFVLAGAGVALWSLLRRREALVQRVESAVRAVLAAVTARRSRAILAPWAPLRRQGAPALLGSSLWCRPPPPR